MPAMNTPPPFRELEHVTGDRPMPGKGMHGAISLEGGLLGHPQVWTPFKMATGLPMILELDVYDDRILVICPVCTLENLGSHGLMIRAGAKAWSYEPLESPPKGFPDWHPEQLAATFPMGLGGRISIEPFRCTWESQPDLQRGFGLQRCSLSVSIRDNVMRIE